MQNKFFIPKIIITSILILNACSKKNTANDSVKTTIPCDSSGTISYHNQIVPIINSSCGSNVGACHNSTSTFGDFTTYQGFTSHPPSHIVHCVKQDDPSNYLPMPLGASKLSDCKIALIVKWVNQGEMNN